MKHLKSMLRHRPERIFHLTIIFLCLSLLLVIAIDVFNVFDLHTRWTADGQRWYFYPYWYEVPVELPTQWLCLLMVVLIFFMSAGAAFQRGNLEEFDFCMLFGVGATLMLFEDSLEVRHHIRFNLIDQGFENYGTVITLVELTYFATIGGLMVFVFLYFRHLFWERDKVRTYLIRGYVCYAIAVGSSWGGAAFSNLSDSFPNLYSWAGQFFVRILFFDGGEREAYFHVANEVVTERDGLPLEFWFMDRVWEESWELLGATALLVAALAFFFDSTANPEDADQDQADQDDADQS